MSSVPTNTARAATLEGSRKFLPLASTVAVFLVVYFAGFLSYPAMRDGQAFFNLFDAAPFLIVTVVGEGFVILSGGIDLSVSGILALTTVVAASLLYMGWNPWAIFPVVLLLGMLFGLVMGLFITYLKVQPFIATLAGMWLARGLCYVISDAEVRIHDATYTTLGQTKILIPGFADPATYHRTGQGDYITYLVVVAMAVFALGLFLAHFTKFGRTVYAMGGGNGANEVSARLMGLPVNRTKVLVYVLSGFCSALAGILYSIYVMSGRGTHGTGFELTAIAAVVIGGIALTGGEGYLIGALVGVLITSLIQSLIQYNGELSSYWVYIVIGALTLVFIGIQGWVAAWNAAAIGRARSGGHAGPKVRTVWYKRKAARNGLVAAAVVVVSLVGVNVLFPFVFPKAATVSCSLKEMRPAQATALVQGNAVIVYERNGGTSCVDELYAIYSDGRIVSDYGGGDTKETSITTDRVSTLLKQINDLGFFTPDFYSTSHTPCGACYRYSTTVTYQGQTKTVDAVDGGTDAPADYWIMTGHLAPILYGSSQ
jgi:ribose/xylose/arabinose/galactoside ABC-type transport system permease subunit